MMTILVSGTSQKSYLTLSIWSFIPVACLILNFTAHFALVKPYLPIKDCV